MRRIIATLIATLALLGMYMPRSDAILATDLRCTTHSFPNHLTTSGFTMVICWQYTYRAQGDGTGVYNESLFAEINRGCDDLGGGTGEKVRDMTLKMVNPKTGAINSSLNPMQPMFACSTNRDLELNGRDVGDETIRWDLTFNPSAGGLDEWDTQFNDCLSLGGSYSGPCRAV